jgi:hypothetical protein
VLKLRWNPVQSRGVSGLVIEQRRARNEGWVFDGKDEVRYFNVLVSAKARRIRTDRHLFFTSDASPVVESTVVRTSALKRRATDDTLDLDVSTVTNRNLLELTSSP